MAKRPFNVVLEEAVNGENTVEAAAMSEAELELLKEEANKNDIDITEEVTAVEELIEEQNVVNTQIQENEEKLTDPDIIVDASDVEVSEECYKNVCYRLGIKAGTTLKFSNESTFNAVKAEPRKYLALSNEGLKEIVKNIWEKIKAFFKKIWAKIQDFFINIGLYKRAEMAKLKKIKKGCSEALKEANGKDFKVNLFDALNGSLDLFKTYYKRDPYVITILGHEDIKKLKIFDPEGYKKMIDLSYSALEKLPNTLSNIVKIGDKYDNNYNREDAIENAVDAMIKDSLSSLEKALNTYENYFYGNEKLASLTKEIVEDKDDLGSSYHPILPTVTHVEFIKINNYAISNPGKNDKKPLEYKNSKYDEDLDEWALPKFKQIEISVKDIDIVCKNLEKQGGILDEGWMRRIQNNQEAVFKKIDTCLKELENRSDITNYEKKRIMIIIDVIREIYNPRTVANFTKACIEHRKMAIDILNNILNHMLNPVLKNK